MPGKCWAYFWGMILRPRSTLEELAGEQSIRPAVFLTIFVLLLCWLNWLIFILGGYDWLGTRGDLMNPTYVGFFGQLRVDLENYVSIFHFLISPMLSLVGLAVMPGLAQVLSKLWGGQATFEQMVNTLIYAQAPSILFRSVINDMLLAGVPANLLAHNPYAFSAAMNGQFGPVIQTLWWVYTIGFYIITLDVWIVILGAIAIQRTQRIPWWAATLIMVFGYTIWFYGIGGSFVR